MAQNQKKQIQVKSLDWDFEILAWILGSVDLGLGILDVGSKHPGHPIKCLALSQALPKIIPSTKYSALKFHRPICWAGHGMRLPSACANTVSQNC